MPYRASPSVLLICPQTGASRAFKSPNALRRAMVTERFSCQGAWGERRWCRNNTDWIAWDVAADAPLDLGPLFAQNKGQHVDRTVRRQEPVANISGRRSYWIWMRARCGQEGAGMRERWQRRAKEARCLVDGEPPMRPNCEGLATRYDDEWFRRCERSWKRHRRNQWKPLET